MHALAAFIARAQPHILGISEIDSGDALALATRFALQWAYRGGQAVFWKPQFKAVSVSNAHPPFSPLRPFERRGVVRVDLEIAGAPVRVFATQMSAERERRIRELRYLRTSLRQTDGPCIVFCVSPPSRIEYGDLGFTRAGCRGVHDETVWVRGFDVRGARDERPERGIGTPLVAALAATAQRV